LGWRWRFSTQAHWHHTSLLVLERGSNVRIEFGEGSSAQYGLKAFDVRCGQVVTLMLQLE
jgi:hypothetical protein